MRGKRGQALLRDLVTALDEMPEKRLVRGVLEQEGSVCALGAVCKKRGVPMPEIERDDDPGEWAETLGATLDIAEQLAAQVMWVNDEYGRHNETPEERWGTVRRWAVGELERIEREAVRKANRATHAWDRKSQRCTVCGLDGFKIQSHPCAALDKPKETP
jgi:hypothetical protein